MKIIKKGPFSELDQFFDDSSFYSFPKFSWDLAVDVYEKDDNVVAKMSLPGIATEEVEVSIEDDLLTVSGRREEEKEVDEKDYYSKEIKRGTFSRTTHLPKSVDALNAEASYDDGILTILMPIVEGAKDKVIKVPVRG